MFEGPDTDAARGVPASGESMRYVSVRAVGSLADAHAVAAAGAAGSALDAARAAAQFARPGGATVVANCGLWDVAYGDDDLGSYGTRLGEVRFFICFLCSYSFCVLIYYFVCLYSFVCGSGRCSRCCGVRSASIASCGHPRLRSILCTTCA